MTASFKTSYVKFSEGVNIIDIFMLKCVEFRANQKEHLWKVLIHYFILKKSAAESYCILREAYGEHAPSQDTCE